MYGAYIPDITGRSKKIISQSVTQAAQKKNLSTPNRNQICDLLWLVTNADALPLSYRSLVGSKATKLQVLWVHVTNILNTASIGMSICPYAQ